MGLMTPGVKEGEEDKKGDTAAKKRTHRGVWALIMAISSKCHEIMSNSIRRVTTQVRRSIGAVSYTHLTLPTKRIV